MTGNVYFDDYLRTKKGKVIPFYDVIYGVDNIEDQKLVWIHESYGYMQLYRLHQIDNTEDFIAEKLPPHCSTKSDKYKLYSDNPELALAEYCS